MIRFYENRYKYFAISIAIFIVGLVFLFTKGATLDIQFKGGAILKYSYTGSLDTSKAEKVVVDTLKRNVNTQTVTDIATNNNMLVLNMVGDKNLSVADQQSLDKAFSENFSGNNMKMESSNSVEPFIGKRFLKKGVTAIVLAFILIVIYVWIRFRTISGLSAGFMALVALVHDCFVVFFTFVIFGIPINESFIAVVLTIVGYSINDTIVIYDRIRENARQKMDVVTLVNKSISQSMSRSVNTCVTTLATAIIVFIFAYIYHIDSITTFAFPMAIGLISGVYSTICLAGPMWVMWQKHKEKGKSLAKAH